VIKKILFSALAMIAFAGGAMASNEIVVESSSDSFIEYKYESIKADESVVSNGIDIKCYVRACMYVGGRKACTEWVEVSCDGADYSIEVEGQNRLEDNSKKDIGIHQA